MDQSDTLHMCVWPASFPSLVAWFGQRDANKHMRSWNTAHFRVRKCHILQF